ncbi:hypothetical protein VP01_1943g3 [Puccinia sorghi]|uniref:Uncharacterized protein n=1 Tax=Puccinia sorghi TaxID=27349 RepID=A0A0L6VCE2_9BASI|nr:hypothetical protein VP01_1943g3 [Puccinia sorghi]
MVRTFGSGLKRIERLCDSEPENEPRKSPATGSGSQVSLHSQMAQAEVPTTHSYNCPKLQCTQQYTPGHNILNRRLLWARSPASTYEQAPSVRRGGKTLAPGAWAPCKPAVMRGRFHECRDREQVQKMATFIPEEALPDNSISTAIQGPSTLQSSDIAPQEWQFEECEGNQVFTLEMVACLNVQHDCHHSQCETVRTVSSGSCEYNAVTMNISHSHTNCYVLNVCSQHEARYHGLLINIYFSQPSDQ